jgi:hypothetical protein
VATIRFLAFSLTFMHLDSAWVVPKDMSRLQTHEINAYIAEVSTPFDVDLARYAPSTPIYA